MCIDSYEYTDSSDNVECVRVCLEQPYDSWVFKQDFMQHLIASIWAVHHHHVDGFFWPRPSEMHALTHEPEDCLLRGLLAIDWLTESTDSPLKGRVLRH